MVTQAAPLHKHEATLPVALLISPNVKKSIKPLKRPQLWSRHRHQNAKDSGDESKIDSFRPLVLEGMLIKILAAVGQHKRPEWSKEKTNSKHAHCLPI